MEMGGILEKLCSVLLGSLTLFPGVGGDLGGSEPSRTP